MPLSHTQPTGVLGNGHEVDSLAACMHAALSQWGRQVAYDCVAGLSGSAFSPALRRGEECAAWWMEGWSEARMEFVGHAVGFSVERIPNEEEDGAEFARRVRAAVAGKAVVLCRSWPCWSILEDWHDDPARRGYLAPAGLEPVWRLATDASYYVIRPAEPALTRCEALREAVRYGARVADGEAGSPECEFGGRLYEAWMQRLHEEPFCPTCGENSWHCAERLASRARGNQLSAAHFLSRAQSFLPPLASDPSAGEAAGSYGIMADTLAPYTWGTGLNLTWGDPEGRSRYVRDVETVRELHGRAADYLGRIACRL
jgi:hypothetical protein